ncbi:MAG: dTDP-4-dehydrorhamnose reductase [Candidatus Amoebophilus sp. 36-38]|nr:MAG: dTDP-4-dehydrorhamnose reductase [Candidatus Amoebophilus sp. 36-38]
MINVLITGNPGQLAQALYHTQHTPHLDLSAIYKSRQELDIAHFKQLRTYLEKNPIHYLVNCAAYTQVDLAETDQANAKTINAIAPGYLASLAKELNFTLLHISTDYVFDGLLVKPLTEDMPTTPTNYYGQTKLAGEQQILAHHTSAYIIRTSWLYSTMGNNFLTRLLNRSSTEEHIHMAYDQLSSPTYALDLAKVIWEIIRLINQNPNLYEPGIYHYANEGVASRYDFAWQVRKRFNLTAEIIAQPFSNFLQGAKRPAYSVLNKEKIKQTFEITVPHWQESLEHCLQHLTHHIL